MRVKHYKAFILKLVQTALPLKQPHSKNPASGDPGHLHFKTSLPLVHAEWAGVFRFTAVSAGLH